jgi:S-methylmethionine-dependent homocysteine/selenocysteine methylase
MNATVRLDGATATELQRRGIPVRAPWWTSAALRTPRGRAVLGAIHAEYAAAGADVITANTFRCNLRSLTRAGLDRPAAARMVHEAVGIARAAAGRRVRVAGSIAPVEDCYRPDLVPETRTLRAEHRWLARELVAAGVDLVVVETMSCEREALVALEEVLAAGGRAYVSFVCGDDARLLSGEPLVSAVRAAERTGASAVLVNCTSIPRTAACLREMRAAARGPIGAYPNVEDRSGIATAVHVDRYLPALVDVDVFATAVLGWRADLGATVLGGCCGTTPAHLAALYGRLTDERLPATPVPSGLVE